MKWELRNDWNNIMGDEFDKEYFKRIDEFLKDDYMNNTVYPEQKDILNALECTEFKDVKVVILGQDPYHGKGQAHGFSFSVRKEIKIPRSLRNIYKELRDDLGCYIPDNGYLMKWAEQGVLLLNSILTVREGCPASHARVGWQNFTDLIIRKLNEREKPIAFIFWGEYAKTKRWMIKGEQHLVIESSHPSPLSARKSFIGSRPFSQVNEFLKLNGEESIDWQIENIKK